MYHTAWTFCTYKTRISRFRTARRTKTNVRRRLKPLYGPPVMFDSTVCCIRMMESKTAKTISRLPTPRYVRFHLCTDEKPRFASRSRRVTPVRYGISTKISNFGTDVVDEMTYDSIRSEKVCYTYEQPTNPNKSKPLQQLRPNNNDERVKSGYTSGEEISGDLLQIIVS